MSRRSIIIIASIFAIVFVVGGIYGTFASSNTVSVNNDSYDITLTGKTETVTIPAGESKTIIYQITNVNKGTVQYGVAYSGTNITVKVYSNSASLAADKITYGENKFVKLHIENTGTAQSTATIKTILGYENGGDLIIPTGYTLVTQSL